MKKESLSSLSDEQLLKQQEKNKQDLTIIIGVAIISAILLSFQIGYALSSDSHSFSKGILISIFITTVVFINSLSKSKAIKEEIKNRNL